MEHIKLSSSYRNCQNDFERAAVLHLEFGFSIRSAAAQFSINLSTFHSYLKQSESEADSAGVGRPRYLDDAEESELVHDLQSRAARNDAVKLNDLSEMVLKFSKNRRTIGMTQVLSGARDTKEKAAAGERS